MDTVIRVAVMYVFLMVVFRLAGKRAMAEITTFDFLMLLIISETTQQAMVNRDHSLTNAFLLILTWVGIDIGLSLLKRDAPTAERWMEGLPLVIVEDGRPIGPRMRKARVDEDDVLAAARELQGLERIDQIKYAVLERNGGISIVPKPGTKD